MSPKSVITNLMTPFRINLQIGDQPFYNIGPTTPTNVETNETTIIEKIFEDLDQSDNCTKCVEKCGMDCKFTCNSIFDCNHTIHAENLGKKASQNFTKLVKFVLIENFPQRSFK